MEKNTKLEKVLKHENYRRVDLTEKSLTSFHLLTAILLVTPGVNVTKLFLPVIYELRNKLECLSLASLSSLV